MIDVITLALIKKYASESSTVVTPEEIEDAVNKYLDEHPVRATPIDDTLTLSGYAADAKAVGDAINALDVSSLREAIEAIQTELESLRQLIIDTTSEEEIASGIVDAGTEILTDEEVEESYNASLIE